MSELKVTNIQHASATSPNITLGSDGSVAVGGGNISPQTGVKNRIINGDMRIDQRNNGASVTVSSGSTSYPVDRMLCYVETGSSGTFTAQRSTVAPAGFINSLLLTTATVDSSIGASEGYSLQHRVEGFNVADLGWGTANAQAVTLSFWVRSSLTGTFAGSISNGSFNRAYVFNFTINAANTFEYKTITILGDTSGTWNTSNGTGLIVYWSLGAGSGLQRTAGSWGNFAYSTSGAVSPIATSGTTFYITGVQLEKGSVATPFEFRSIGQEEILCKRYYQIIGKEANTFGLAAYASAAGQAMYIGVPYNTEMRAAPTVTVNAGAANATVSVIAGSNSLRYDLTSVAAGRMASSGNANTLVMSSEL